MNQAVQALKAIGASPRLEALAVFIASGLFYFSIGYSVARYSAAMYQGFDCILSLDSSVRFSLFANALHQDSYVISLHPFAALWMRPLYGFFLPYFPQQAVAMLAAQAAVSAVGIMFFNLTLRKLRFSPQVRWLAVALYAGSFSMLLFTVYTETYHISAASLAVVYYVLAARPRWFVRPLPAALLGIVAISANILNFAHYCIIQGVSWVIRPRWKTLWPHLAAIAIALVAVALLSFFLKASGFMLSAINEYSPHARGQSKFITALYGAPIQDLWDWAYFIRNNLVTPSVYLEIYERLFYAPLIAAPITTMPPLSWSHGCTDFIYRSWSWPWGLGLVFFALSLIGIYRALRRGRRFMLTVVAVLLFNVFFYGFVYLRATAYLYSLNYLLLYVFLIALGMEALRGYMRKWPAAEKCCMTIMTLMVMAGIAHSIYQLGVLNSFALVRFKL